MRPEKKIIHLLQKKGKTLSTAESCSGGLLSSRITDIPGSSSVFLLGITAYDNRAKTKLLHIPPAIIRKHGAVSKEVSVLMAKNVRKILNTDIGIGITGIAGPAGHTPFKPVGLVYISASFKNKSVCRRFMLKGTRRNIKRQAATEALRLITAAASG